jgi:hypothetical protein
MLILWLLACSEPPVAPKGGAGVGEVVTVEDRAIDAHDRAMAAREASDWEQSIFEWSKAIELDPESPSLRLWLAQTHLDANQLESALSVLSQAVRDFPADPTCRYNRAALRARTGDIGGAADDLRRLKAMGALNPDETGSDPDFAALRADPVFSDLVAMPRIGLSGKAPEGAVLLGETWELELELSVPSLGSSELHWSDSSSSILRLESVIEEEKRLDARVRESDLYIRWRAVESGKSSAGPWRVSHGGGEAQFEAQSVEVMALGHWAGGESRPDPDLIPIPRTLMTTMNDQGVGRAGDWVAVRLSPGEVLRVEPEQPLIALEWRRFSGEIVHASAFRVDSDGVANRVYGGSRVERLEIP